MEKLSALKPRYPVLCPERLLFDLRNGTWLVETIRASGHVCRVNRPISDNGTPATSTVSAVAMDWGFWHFGEFSKAYKSCFHEMPSQTLRRK
jgi:hypothetical protein